ncbi:MAG: hypothetical protein LBT40_10150 [Deltaproteobacteria bacterium]|nr:hypothetical protein [Deltaproteobacteria bacterium]
MRPARTRIRPAAGLPGNDAGQTRDLAKALIRVQVRTCAGSPNGSCVRWPRGMVWTFRPGQDHAAGTGKPYPSLADARNPSGAR